MTSERMRRNLDGFLDAIEEALRADDLQTVANGDDGVAPYIVTELMGGGDVEGELEKATPARATPGVGV